MVVPCGASGGKSLDSYGEQPDEDQPERIGRHRVEEESGSRAGVIEAPVALHGLHNPDRDGDDNCEHERSAHKEHVAGQVRRNDAVDAPVELVRETQVPVYKMVQEYPVLVPERAVVTVLLVPRRDPDRVGARAEDGLRHATGDEVLQAEGDQSHPEDDYDGLSDPPDDVPGQLERLIPLF